VGLEFKQSAPILSGTTFVSIAHFLQKTALGRRPSHLAVIVLANEATAFQAYRLLHYHGISPENLAIVGDGYSTLDRVGLRSPTQIAIRKARNFSLIAATSGAVICLIIAILWKVELTLIALLPAIAGLVCGICGAIMGALFGFLGEGNTAGIYRHHLHQGRYLLLIEGSEKLVRWGQDVLSHYSAPSLH
jgi:hypothetical protein